METGMLTPSVIRVKTSRGMRPAGRKAWNLLNGKQGSRGCIARHLVISRSISHLELVCSVVRQDATYFTPVRRQGEVQICKKVLAQISCRKSCQLARHSQFGERMQNSGNLLLDLHIHPSIMLASFSMVCFKDKVYNSSSRT
jgi:hypothetical protein